MKIVDEPEPDLSGRLLVCRVSWMGFAICRYTLLAVVAVWAACAPRHAEIPDALPPQPVETTSQQTTPGQIIGVALSPDSVPLAGAVVTLVGTGRGTITSPTGAFRFDAVPPGQYHIRVSAIGFAAEASTVVVSPGDAISVPIGGSSARFTLTPPPGMTVEVFIVPSVRWSTSPCSVGSTIAACQHIARKRPFTVSEPITVWQSAEPREFVQVCQNRIARISHFQPVRGSTNDITVRCT
jgi:hypothetical protein